MNFLFQYSFIQNGLAAGIIIAVIAPIIGMFLVLRRYSLIADTLAHVSLAGIAVGLILKLPPFITAIITAAISSVMIEKLRTSRKVYGESALALFLSGSLAVAVLLLSIGKGLNGQLFTYLFGSIITVSDRDVLTIFSTGLMVITLLYLFYKELIYVTFDEEAARVSGIPTNWINLLLIVLTALTISLAIPIVGILLISALIVVPVITALQFRKSFTPTLVIAEGVSVLSVITGIIVSFNFDVSPGATIVLITIACFILSLFLKPIKQ